MSDQPDYLTPPGYFDSLLDETDQGSGEIAKLRDLAVSNSVVSIERHHRAVSVAPGDLLITPTPWTWRDEATIPPREFIYAGHYVRSYLSQTVANYGVGKSSLTIAEAMVIASDVPFLGIEPRESCPVWVFNGEDPLVELERKVYAAMKFHRLAPRKLAGRLFFDSGRMLKMKVARRLNGSAVICQDVADAIRKAIERNGIGVMIVDPFVTTHAVGENNNDEMEVVASTWADIANDTNCSIEIVHHARKTNGADVTMDDARGASSVAAKARSGRLLNPMKASDGAAVGANPFEFFRASYGKSSLRPRTMGEEWYRFHSVKLANGDDVGAIGPVQKPSALENVAEGDLEKAQEAIREGQWRWSIQSKEWAGYPIIAALGLNPDEKSDKDRVYGLIKAWKGQGHFVVADRYDPRNKKRNQFLEPHKSPTPADDADTSPTPPISDTLDTWSFQRCDTYTHPL